MGNLISKYDPSDQSDWDYQRCRCRKTSSGEGPIDWKALDKLRSKNRNEYELRHPYMLATYRCEYHGPVADEYGDIPGYPWMRQYWSCTTIGCRQYIACDKCITEETCQYFAYHMNGWKAHQEVILPYEPILLETKSQKLL